MKIKILATGGTLDKIYYDATSDFHIGDPMAKPILEEANVTFDFEVESILKKDSLDMDDADRETIRLKVQQDPCDRIVIIHGTDTMIKTAMCLLDIENKTIVITGAMQPARMRFSDSARDRQWDFFSCRFFRKPGGIARPLVLRWHCRTCFGEWVSHFLAQSPIDMVPGEYC